MKRTLLVGALAGLLAIGAAAESVTAQDAKAGEAKATKAAKTHKASQAGGYVSATAPKTQGSGPEAPPPVPDGTLALGSVRLPRAVKANGEALKAGTYQVRLTPQEAEQKAPGATPTYERWVEFVQGGAVKGKEVVSIVPQGDVSKVAKGSGPAAGSAKVELLKGDDYLRVWINRGGNSYLIHLVPAA
jgi:hypothetical protein